MPMSGQLKGQPQGSGDLLPIRCAGGGGQSRLALGWNILASAPRKGDLVSSLTTEVLLAGANCPMFRQWGN